MSRTTATNTSAGHLRGTAGPRRRPRARPGSWAGYSACVWGVLFAAMSFYWAAGGLVGQGTIGPAVEGPALAREPGFVALMWITAVLKLAAAALGLALATGHPHWLPRWLLLLAGWGAASLLSLYGVANLVQHLLIVAGVVDLPTGLGGALPWHLFLWNPVWLSGAILFTLATVFYSRTSREHKSTKR